MTFGTQVFELWVDTEVKVYLYTFKKDISFWIYVEFGMKTFRFIFPVFSYCWQYDSYCWQYEGGLRFA